MTDRNRKNILSLISIYPHLKLLLLFGSIIVLLIIIFLILGFSTKSSYNIDNANVYLNSNQNVLNKNDNSNQSIDNSYVDNSKKNQNTIKPVKLSIVENNYKDTDEIIYNSFYQSNKYNDIQYCYQISYVNLRGDCITSIALKNLDLNICDKLDDIYKELNNIDEDNYYLKTAVPGVDSDYCKQRISRIQLIIDKINLINKENNNQFNYIVEKCLTELKQNDYKTIYSLGCDFGDFAQKNKDLNYCYFLEENNKFKCIQSIEYIKLIDYFELNGSIDDCNKIPSNFYFKGSMYLWCLGRFNNK